MSARLSIEEIAQLADIAASRGVTIRIFPSGKVEIIAQLPEMVTPVTNGNSVAISQAERNAEKQRRYRERRKSEQERLAATPVTS